MNNVDNIEGIFYRRLNKPGLKILLAGTDRSQLGQVKAFLPGNYETRIWELAASDVAPQKGAYDVVVLVGSPALSYLTKVKSLAGWQTPIIGYEMEAGTNERVQARAGGIICLVNHSPEEMELTIAIENVISWGADHGGQKEQNVHFRKELVAALDHLFEEKPSFRIQDLSRCMKLSHSTLYRKVREIYKISPNRLIAAYRSQQAAMMLTEGKLSITEIAYTCGFSSATYFARTFKQFYGSTPGQFRKGSTISARFVRIIE
jgi:AraC-like DNA-binding protein